VRVIIRRHRDVELVTVHPVRRHDGYAFGTIADDIRVLLA
jgi:hypothetical protein